MQTLIRVLVLTAFLALTVSTLAMADDRPVITVRFVLVDAKYKVKFSDAERAVLEAAAARRLAEQLGGRIGFVRFTTDNADIVLTFELNRQDPSGTGDIREVGFHVTLRRQGQSLGDGTYVMFRPQTESLASIPGHEALLEAIGPRVGEAAAPRGSITTLLGAIPIAREAVFVKSPLGWVIPYKHDDLCMDEASVVRLSNTVDAPAATLSRQFTARTSGRYKEGALRGRILSEPHPTAQDHLEDLMNAPADKVRVGEVYVVQYSPRTPCDAVVAPAPR